MHPIVEMFGDPKRYRLVELSHILARLDPIFEEPIDRAALLPGYSDQEASVGEIDGWPPAYEPVGMLRTGDQSYGLVTGAYVLALAKKLKKEKVPCYFLNRSEIPEWAAAYDKLAGLPTKKLSSEEEEELEVRAFYSV